MQPSAATSSKPWPVALLKLAISAGLLYLLFRSLDVAAVAGMLGRLPAGALALGVAFFLVQFLVLGLRWWLVMAAIEAPLGFARTLQLTLMGVFFNQVLPTSFGGDAVRIWQAYRLGIGADVAAIGVFLERASGVFGVVVLTALGAWYMGPAIDNPALRLSLFAALPVAVLGVAALALLDRMPETWQHLPFLKDVARLARDSRRVFLTPRTALPLLLLSVLSHGLAAAVIYAFAEGLGLGLPALTCIALFSAVILVTTIPISFAGWGLREGAMVALFAFAGVSADAALALSLAFGLVFLVASLPGCALWLTWRNTSVTETTP